MTNTTFLDHTGTLQNYSVTTNGTYQIVANGAAGGNAINVNTGDMYQGNMGASLGGSFNLTAGTELSVVVGGVGLSNYASPNGPIAAGGGGGGTFVYEATGGIPKLFLVAGGGGGAGLNIYTTPGSFWGTEQGLTFVHPFDDPEVIAGQGTIAMEILRQHQGPLHAVFVAIGGGGLIAGVANYIKAVRPEVKVIGVQMNDSNAMIQSVAAKKRVTLPDVGLFSDGTAVKLVGEETFRIARGLVDDYIMVDTDSVCAAIKDIFVDTRSIVEPSGALAVAAIKQYVATHKTKGETYAAILCGANMNFDRLRFVAERAEVGEEREALLAVTIPEERGSFRRFCELIGSLPGGPRNVTEFNYRISDAAKAHVFVGLTTHGKGESAKITASFSRHGFAALDLTHDDLAQEHIRHMVGGHSTLAQDERLLRFVFPERPGALLKFLSLMRPGWNISLFHYRNQGADYGRILVGLQVPKADSKVFAGFLDALGYPYVEETHNPVYKMFLQS